MQPKISKISFRPAKLEVKVEGDTINIQYSNIFTAEELKKMINIFPFMSPPITMINNNFVSAIYDINELKNESNLILDSELSKILINSESDDNPILILYSFE